MASNTDNPMEKLLRRYAERRRAAPGASQDLHPATRQLLQSEVKRRYPSALPGAAPKSSMGWFFRWPGLAAVGTTTLLLCIGLIWWANDRSSSRIELARNETRDRIQPVSPAGSRPGDLAAKAEMQSRPSQELKVKDLNVLKEQNLSLTVSAPTPAPSSALLQRSMQRDAGASAPTPKQIPEATALAADSKWDRKVSSPISDKRNLAGSTVALAPSSTPTPAAPSNFQNASAAAPPSAVGLTYSPNAQMQQRLLFQRSDSKSSTLAEAAPPKAASAERSKRISPSPNLLNTFEFRYGDGTAQVIDQDGSVYQGTFNGTPTPVFQNAPASAVPSGSTTNLYPFQVSGTNRSMRQRVSITGYLKPSQALADLNAKNQAAAQQESLNAIALPGSAWELNAIIQLGTNNNRPLNANKIGVLPAAPQNAAPASQRP